LWPIPIRPRVNCFAPPSQNESGWPTAAASWKTVIKFACSPSARGSTFKLASRAESRRPYPRAKAKRNRSVPLRNSPGQQR
jgi:hypothetical protein